jgi:hypothetical protein
LCEQSIQLLLSCILGQIPYIELDFHSDCFLRLSDLKNKPPAHNRVGGKETTQIQLLIQLFHSVYHTL